MTGYWPVNSTTAGTWLAVIFARRMKFEHRSTSKDCRSECTATLFESPLCYRRNLKNQAVNCGGHKINTLSSLSNALRKAAVNAPHFRRFATFGDARQSRSVWSARVFSTAFGG